MRGDLRDAHSDGRPQILEEHVDHEVVRLIFDPSYDTAAIVGREMRSQGLDLSNESYG
jgi:hypothetical protein